MGVVVVFATWMILMRGKKSLIFTSHALERFRERWPECAHMERSTIWGLIEKQIAEAEKNDDLAICEGGTYYPVSLMGKDGFAVVNGRKVMTILPEEYCQQVVSVLNKKRLNVTE